MRYFWSSSGTVVLQFLTGVKKKVVTRARPPPARHRLSNCVRAETTRESKRAETERRPAYTRLPEGTRFFYYHYKWFQKGRGVGGRWLGRGRQTSSSCRTTNQTRQHSSIEEEYSYPYIDRKRSGFLSIILKLVIQLLKANPFARPFSQNFTRFLLKNYSIVNGVISSQSF